MLILKQQNYLLQKINKFLKINGLDFEARQFGECMKTDDMKIGLKNFLENGPKVKAEFVHR